MNSKKMLFFHKKYKSSLIILFIAISIFNLILAINHEYWRDEAQAWLIARDCSLTPDSLFTVTSYEGHPFLWFLLLMPFAKLGFPFTVLKYISWSIMTISLFVFLLKVNMPSWLKALICISPIYIYFFTVPARSYSLASFLIICISIIYNKRKEYPILYSLLLSMLLQTLIIMGGFVTALGIAWFVETLICLIKKKSDKRTLVKNIVGLTILLSSALFLLWEFRYTTISSSNSYPPSLFEIMRKLAGQYKYGFEILFGNLYLIAFFLINISIVGLFISNTKSRIPLLLAGIGILWQTYIYAYVHPNSSHRLLSWIYLLIFVLIVSYDDLAIYRSPNNIFISIIIIIYLLLSWNDNYFNDMVNDLRQDMAYSYSKEVADIINELPEDSIILSLSQIHDTSVAAQIDNKHYIYNIFNDQKSTFFDWNPANHKTLTINEFFEKVQKQFPHSNTIYAIVANDACDVIGIEEYIQHPHPNISIVYESSHNYIIEDFTLIAITNM